MAALTEVVTGSGWPAMRDCSLHALSSYDDWIAELTSKPMVAPDGIVFECWGEVEDYRGRIRRRFKTYFDSLSDEQLQAVREVDVDGELIHYSPAELF